MKPHMTVVASVAPTRSHKAGHRSENMCCRPTPRAAIARLKATLVTVPARRPALAASIPPGLAG